MSMHNHYLAEESKHVFAVTDNGIAYYHAGELVRTLPNSDPYQAMLTALDIQYVTARQMSDLIFAGEDMDGTYLAESSTSNDLALVRWGVNIGSITNVQDEARDVHALAAAHQNVVFCRHNVWPDEPLPSHTHDPQEAVEDVVAALTRSIGVTEAAIAAMNEDGDAANAQMFTDVLARINSAIAPLLEQE